MWKLAVALLVLGNLDQGIFADLSGRVAIHSPNWSVSDGPLAIRIDEQAAPVPAPKHARKDAEVGWEALTRHRFLSMLSV